MPTPPLPITADDVHAGAVFAGFNEQGVVNGGIAVIVFHDCVGAVWADSNGRGQVAHTRTGTLAQCIDAVLALDNVRAV